MFLREPFITQFDEIKVHKVQGQEFMTPGRLFQSLGVEKTPEKVTFLVSVLGGETMYSVTPT